MTGLTDVPSPVMTGGILRRTADGAALMVVWRMINRVLGLASTLILVRLLAPDDFGLVTLAFGLSHTLGTSTALGVEAQIVRSRNASRALYDTGFTFNLIRGLLLGTLVFALSEPAASWFRDERLTQVLMILAILPIMDGLMNIGMMEYKRHLRFDKDFYFLSITRLNQVIVTVSAAFIFRNYLAMIFGIIVARLFALWLSYAMHPYRPRFSFAARRELLGVSLWTWLISVAVVVRDRGETFLIARLLDMRSVGLFAVAVEIAGLAFTELISPLAQTLMPGFAATIREARNTAVATALQRALAVTFLIAAPAGFGLSLTAEPIVLVALGERWAAAGPLITVMGVAFIPVALGLISESLLVAHAALRTVFAITAVAAILRLAAMLAVGVRFGLLGLAIAGCAIQFVERLVLVEAARRQAGLGLCRLLDAQWRTLVATLVMAAVLVSAGLGWHGVPAGDVAAAAWRLAKAVPGGVLVFVGALGALWWAMGRPTGAERDVAAYAAEHVAARLRRRGRAARNDLGEREDSGR